MQALRWFLDRLWPPRLTSEERARLPEFAALSLNDVRARGWEFESANDPEAVHERFTGWQASDRDDGLPHMPYGNPADWYALAAELRERGVWRVGELPENEQIRWAKRLAALSSFSHP
jgi:hypothetical protein